MVTIQARIPEDSYKLLVSLLKDGETVSDFVRDAIKLESALRLLPKS